MAGIQSMGIGSGLDIKSLVQQLVTAEGQPEQTRITTDQKNYQTQLSAIGVFKGALSSFQTAVTALQSFNSFLNHNVTSSDSTIVGGTADTTAANGTYQVEVTNLAKAQTLMSTPFTSSTTTVGTGALTFQFGDPSKAAQTVTIDTAHSSLQGIRDAVNAANIGVQASIINGAAGAQLLFTSTSTGTANSLKVSVSESPAAGSNTDMTGLSQLAYDPTAGVGAGKNMTQTVAAEDATVLINGVSITSATNTVTGAVDGLTLNLVKESPGTTVNLTVGQDTAPAASLVQSFVKAYNSFITTETSIAGYNSKTKVAGPLNGDAMVRGITNQLRQVVGNMVSGLGGNYHALVDIGVTTNKDDGTLVVDSAKLNKALAANIQDVGKLFAAAGDATDSLVSYTSSTGATKPGSYDVNISQAATQGTYLDTASSVGSLVVDNTNSNFSIKVDGTTSGTISLTQKTYASGAALAAELQSRINGDNTLKNAGVSVTVAFDAVNNRFSFTSNSYGSNSGVSITTVEDTTASGNIGLTVNAGAATAGKDVAGTIGSWAATGAGQYLTGTVDAAGLKLKVTGSGTGSRGSVDFTRGIADQLNTLLNQYLGTNNVLDSRTSSINSSLQRLSDQQDALNRRLTTLQTQYTNQFNAMDSLVAQLNSTGSFLTNWINQNSSSTKSG